MAGLPPSLMTSRVMRRARVRQTSVETLKDSLIMSRPSLPPTPPSSTRNHPVPILNRKEVHQVKLLAQPVPKEKSTKKHRRSSRRAQDASAGDRRRTRTRARKKEATTMTTSLVARSAKQLQMRDPRKTPPMT